MSEALHTLLNINLALALAVAGVMAARVPVRWLFGARVGYGLWILPPLTALAMLAPARVMTVVVPSLPAQARPPFGETFAEAATTAANSFDVRPLGFGVWLAGIAVSLIWLACRQAQFTRAARAGRAGPAVVGVLRPRVVTPADFAERYTAREREIVLAHERAHLERGDPAINAAVALLTCVNWFNPAIHVMGRWLRIDQELACDARVIAAHPKARRIYAEAMLKTQLADWPLPLGCCWATHPLAQRVRLLSRPTPSRARRLVGGGVTVALGLAAGIGTWAARPAEMVLVSRPFSQPSPVAPIALVSDPTPRVPSAPTRPRGPIKPRDTSSEVKAVKVAAIDTPPPVQVEPTPAVFALAPAADASRMRIIRAVARRSTVEPGSAVRVVASGLSPDGVPLWADFTAFGSQQLYRKGSYERNGSRFSLFTSVVQDGQRLRVTVSLTRAFHPDLTASIDLAPNQTGVLRLPTGQPIVVTTTVRSETAEEIEEGRRFQAAEGSTRRMGWL
jgi:beta-lactamase regulating signal transducer with metallopeptidase domain